MREDSHFETLYKKWEIKASTLNLEMKMTDGSRQKIVPIRYEQISHPSAPAQLGQKEKLRVDFRGALDLITNELEKRFDQKCFDSLIKIESIFTDDMDTASTTSEDLKQKL